jgi:hypothetical protein
MIRRLVLAVLLVVAAIAILVSRRSSPPASAPAGDMGTLLPDSIAAQPAADPGVSWTPPAAWASGPARPLRLATYRPGSAPPAGSGPATECAVFYFGDGAGGTVDDNVDRWVAQFEGSPNPRRTRLRAGGLDVVRVEIDGAFLAPGDDMRSRGRHAGWKLLGAIVQGPRGPVFFKFTGPAAVVSAEAVAFDAMLATLASR